MKKRKYTKKSKYWDQFKSPPEGGGPSQAQDFVPPIFAGENYYVENSLGSFGSELSASRNESTALSDTRRRNSIYYKDKNKKLTNIENGLLPF